MVGTIEATTDLVIGLPDQPLEHQLGEPIAVRTDDEGHIYVADRFSREIKVFYPDGDYLHSIGRRGRGPGEFEVFELMVYTSESQYKSLRSQGVGRATEVHYGGEVHWGSQFSMDAGLFSLEDGRMVHFYAEWKEGYEQLSESMSHPMDLYVQIFGLHGELQHHGYLLSFVERFTFPVGSVVKWMDEKKNFYMLDHPDEVPVVRRFMLDF